MSSLKVPMLVAPLNTHPTKVLEGCRVRWLQTVMRRRSFCVALF